MSAIRAPPRSRPNDGTLVYVSDTSTEERRLVIYDRSGKELDGFGPPGRYAAPTLSPDATRVAFSAFTDAEQADVWIWELHENARLRVTDDSASDPFPVWSPDEGSLVFSSHRDPRNAPEGGLYPIDLASREVELLLPLVENGAAIPKFATHWTADGRYLVYGQPRGGYGGAYEIWALPLMGDRSPLPIARGTADMGNGQVSPDGGWIAFTAMEEGIPRVVVQRFPQDVGGTVVSDGPGMRPRWRGDGKELFYLAPPGELMAIDVETGRSFRHGRPRPLFEVNAYAYAPSPTPYDVTKDGERFVLAEPERSSASELRVVVNWDRALSH